jgi:hypothetical protein
MENQPSRALPETKVKSMSEDDDDDDDPIFSPADDHNEHFLRPSTIDELSNYPLPSSLSTSIFGMDYIYDMKESLLQLHPHYEGEEGKEGDLNHHQNKEHTSYSSSSSLHQHTSKQLIWKEMKKLMNILIELLQTEMSYVHDLKCLSFLLHDCYYCTLPSIKLFVNSKAFGGFYVSTDNIYCMNSLFLDKLQLLMQPLLLFQQLNENKNNHNLSHMMNSKRIVTRRVSKTGSEIDDERSDDKKGEDGDEEEEEDDEKDGDEQTFQMMITLIDSLTQLFAQYSPLFVQYKHFITFHPPISQLFTTSYSDTSNLHFRDYIDTQQTLYENTFLSLSIKPVQRLPRYILLCKEIHNTLHKLIQYYSPENQPAPLPPATPPTSRPPSSRPTSSTLETASPIVTKSNSRTPKRSPSVVVAMREKRYEQLYATRRLTYNVHTMISNCTLHCNNTMKDYDDLQKLHSIHQRLYEHSNSIRFTSTVSRPFPVVVKGRIFILEGEITRHHRRGGNKTYTVYLFNDMMILCTAVGSQNGLKLEFTIPLYRNSMTMCVSIPSPVLIPPSHLPGTLSISVFLFLVLSFADRSSLLQWKMPPIGFLFVPKRRCIS